MRDGGAPNTTPPPSSRAYGRLFGSLFRPLCMLIAVSQALPNLRFVQSLQVLGQSLSRSTESWSLHSSPPPSHGNAVDSLLPFSLDAWSWRPCEHRAADVAPPVRFSSLRSGVPATDWMIIGNTTTAALGATTSGDSSLSSCTALSGNSPYTRQRPRPDA